MSGFFSFILFLVPTILLIIAINWSKKHTVQKDDEDIMIARIHWISLLPSWLFFTIIFFAVFIAPELAGIIIIPLIVVAIFTKLRIFRCWVNFFTTELSVTPTRLVGKRGLFNVERMDIPIEQVTSVTIRTNLWGQIFKYATISIQSAGGNVEFEGIGNAVKFQQYCVDILKINADRQLYRQAQAMSQAFAYTMQRS